MKLKILFSASIALVLSSVIRPVFGSDTETDEFEGLDENDILLKELKWDFFDESSCFVHDGLKINGSGPTRGLVATQDFNAGDKIIDLTDQCLICPDDILEETPVIHFLRASWKHRVDHKWTSLDETTMILIFHLLLSETNMHHSSIPNNIQYRINFPFFWKEDFVNNFDIVSQYRISDERKSVRRLFNMVATWWPAGLGNIEQLTEKVFATAYYQAVTRAAHVVIGDPNSPRNLLNFCFSPILDLVNWAQFYNSKQESIYDDTILTIHTDIKAGDEITRNFYPINRMPPNIAQLIKMGFSFDERFNHKSMEKNGVKIHFKAELFQKLCYKFAKEKRYDDGWYCQDTVRTYWPDHFWPDYPSQIPLHMGISDGKFFPHRILQNIIEDLSEDTTHQIEFIEYLLQVKYLELEANQKLEHMMASEFKKTMRIHIMEEVMRWRNYFARSRQVKKSSDWVTFPYYHDQIIVGL